MLTVSKWLEEMIEWVTFHRHKCGATRISTSIAQNLSSLLLLGRLFQFHHTEDQNLPLLISLTFRA